MDQCQSILTSLPTIPVLAALGLEPCCLLMDPSTAAPALLYVFSFSSLILTVVQLVLEMIIFPSLLPERKSTPAAIHSFFFN